MISDINIYLLGASEIMQRLNFNQKKPPINGGTTNPRNQRISCFSSLHPQDSILLFLYNT
ncbi:hypothetical protein GPAL_0734 [Glaciecola pallidula DSM 14239 = ACAM 615]|jgi:hypothetical protein|uniref:Uncharacterized protein n=1 Tax=Brumicola pallidula DSM 14239 = ACAM 615 TaxID=1121922 RepID=K6Y495_9ALTE|nr:hypothetical protein GPAL_0734 [Glaciecola pallidula DSM 14239 = ACAM 615]